VPRQGRAAPPLLVALALALAACKSDDAPAAGGACAVSDADGVSGGSYTFELDASDTAFTPLILKAQNGSQVTLTVKNGGTKPHDFTVGCIVANGCTACFPNEAKVATVAPGASATVTFTTPPVEGIYDFSSDIPGDGFSGQFIVQ
jgi:uncharacterized cupredoxin-like copper-binding protein